MSEDGEFDLSELVTALFSMKHYAVGVHVRVVGCTQTDSIHSFVLTVECIKVGTDGSHTTVPNSVAVFMLSWLPGYGVLRLETRSNFSRLLFNEDSCGHMHDFANELNITFPHYVTRLSIPCPVDLEETMGVFSACLSTSSGALASTKGELSAALVSATITRFFSEVDETCTHLVMSLREAPAEIDGQAGGVASSSDEPTYH